MISSKFAKLKRFLILTPTMICTHGLAVIYDTLSHKDHQYMESLMSGSVFFIVYPMRVAAYFAGIEWLMITMTIFYLILSVLAPILFIKLGKKRYYFILIGTVFVGAFNSLDIFWSLMSV